MGLSKVKKLFASSLAIIPTLNIPTVSRIGLDIVLKKQFARLTKGVVMDVGSRDSPYKKLIPCTNYLRVDISKESKPDICCDVHDIKWKSNYFDTVISTEVLEHLYNPQTAINEIHPVLKKGGVCILSTRFIYPYHPDPHDYFRFSEDGLRHLFRDFRKVEIHPHGNRLQTLWQVINSEHGGIVLNIFNPLFARINFKKTKFPLGFVVYATK